MKKFTSLTAAAALGVASATASMAGSPTAGTDDPFIPPVPPASSSAGSLGGGAGLAIAGVAAAVLIAAAASNDSDSASTHVAPLN